MVKKIKDSGEPQGTDQIPTDTKNWKAKLEKERTKPKGKKKGRGDCDGDCGCGVE